MHGHAPDRRSGILQRLGKTRRGPAIAAIISRRYSAVEPIEKVDQMKLGLVAQEAGHAQQAVGFQPES